MELQHLFFDSEQPCPPMIPNCENLRKEFLRERDELRSKSGCTSCMENNLKNKYLMFIMALTKL